MGKLTEMSTNETNMTCPGKGWQMGGGGLVPCARRLPTRAAWFCIAAATCPPGAGLHRRPASPVGNAGHSFTRSSAAIS